LYNSSSVEKTNGMTFNPTFFKIDLLIYISPIECALKKMHSIKINQIYILMYP